ncbi:MAG TPA: TnsD family Tn7-like transposition protein [Spirochaetia bacterium]|nr:TnsD family Tn7-like transposition protein [Spirochaetia bacterium]
MITVFPDPYPEELMYSVVARYQERLMETNRKAALLDLFGTANALAVVNLPSHLGALVANLPRGSYYSSEILIKRHTLLPYFAPFLERDQLASVMWDMIGERGPAVAGRAGLMASTVREPSTLQFCPRCADTDRAKYGEAFWHRVHQLPGVGFCPHHSGTTVLGSSVSKHNATTRHGFVTLEAVLGDGGCAFEEMAGQYRPVLEFVARESLWLLQNWTPAVGLVMIKERYTSALQLKDMALPSGRVRVRELVGGFIDALGRDLLPQLGCDLPADSEHTWLQRMVRHPKGSQHPLKHLLLLYFLGLDAGTLLNPVIRKNKAKIKSWPCLNPAADHYGMPVIPAPLKIYCRTDGRDCGVFACDCGFSYRCTLDADPFRGARVLSFGAVWETRLTELSQTPGVSLRGAARLLKVDPGTITHHAARLKLPRWAKSAEAKESPTPGKDTCDTHRRNWLRHQADNPGVSRTELRRALEGTYIWLYRHDREWLMRTQPESRPKVRVDRKTRVNWAERDHAMAAQVDGAVERLKMRSNPIARISATAIGRELGCLSWLQKHPEKMPNTWNRIGEVVEDRVAFACRRLQQTRDSFVDMGIHAKAWQLLRQARIRDDLAKLPVIRSLIETLGLEKERDGVLVLSRD